MGLIDKFLNKRLLNRFHQTTLVLLWTHCKLPLASSLPSGRAVHCTAHTEALLSTQPQYTFHTTQSQSTLHSPHCTVHTAQSTLHSTHCTVHTAPHTLHRTYCTISIKFHRTHFTLIFVFCTLHNNQCTLHTALWTLHASTISHNCISCIPRQGSKILHDFPEQDSHFLQCVVYNVQSSVWCSQCL